MNEEITGFINMLADEASLITMDYYNKNYDIKNKSEVSFDPVTAADLDVEKRLVSLITDKYPKAVIISEESNPIDSCEEPHWIIDPIDGTKAFIVGAPVWSTLIGYNDGNKTIVGLMDQPYLNVRYFGNLTHSILYNNGLENIIKTNNTSALSDSIITCTTPEMFSEKEMRKLENLNKVTKFCRWGLDALGYCLLASGKIDIVIESNINNYDIQPLIPIIESSGGVVTNWEGEEILSGGQVLASANQTLHDGALSIINN